ncbi:MAG: cardiolipin synthase [Planctomycetota bacterium]
MPLLAELTDDAGWIANLVLAADWLIRVGLSVRVVMRRTSVGVSLSWLTVVLLLPFVGAAIYLVVGENRLGRRRARRTVVLHNAYAGWRSRLRDRPGPDWSALPAAVAAVHRHAASLSGLPALAGNDLRLIADSHEALGALAEDIDRAEHRCHLEFYIWFEGGEVQRVVGALCRAAERGVACRVLVDAVGSKKFLDGGDDLKKLRDAGVEVVASLPAGLVRAVFRRLDLRNHRKLAVIDGRVAYTGSLNMIDPKVYKHEAGVGAWIDAMVRVEGPAVEALAVIFLEDWQLETGEDLGQLDRDSLLRRSLPSADDPDEVEPAPPTAGVQAVPSGPSLRPEAIHHVLIAAIYAAQKTVTITTPYFVPDEALLIALTSAAARGVDTLIILPEQNDSVLVRHASNACLGDLLAAGVKVARFRGGLLHTKSVTVDEHLSLFGTVNLDMRSFYLNFELTLLVYDRSFTRRLSSLQQSYVMNTTMVDLKAWRNRPYRRRLADNAARLLGPLL